MHVRTFHIGNYLRDGEHFHFARKHLEARPPRVLHTHDYPECFWLERGRVVHWVNGEKFPVEPGRLVFMRAEDTHGFQALGSEPCRIVNVMFHPESALHLVERYRSDLGAKFFWSASRLPESYALLETQQQTLDRLAHELQTGPQSLARIESFLLGVMTRVVDHSEDVADHAPPWLISACQASRDPEVFRQGAAGFVRVAGRAHEHVCRTARQYLGVSPSAYINRLRMEHAARLLSGSDDSITNIALDCGLENLSHFYRMFRDRFGTTPRAYRLRHHRDAVQPAR
ncbi:MAG: AraC family transcriptional regulator [Pseudomonadota bacterium]